eukprot:CAMPEP_0182443370 /NCGR_PEP_ID=MMETSP1172-20130603/2125_1 /TAXON_ID=708627 /ORGANISM="Timspurckia oligopyrenoides, Strain CCMP3278" /LENGTH=514 /DNA_ID=CAMNT_0024638631 /DNA_START=44 /DNA_END=1588 /DNA_ORIENTATION=-
MKLDVEMKDSPVVETQVRLPAVFDAKVELKRCIGYVERATNARDVRTMARILRQVSKIRSSITRAQLEAVAAEELPAESKTLAAVLSALKEVPEDFHVHPSVDGAMDTEDDKDVAAGSGKDKPQEEAVVSDRKSPTTVVPEIASLLDILTLSMLIDSKKIEKAVEFSASVALGMMEQNRRSLDEFRARFYFLYSHAHELAGSSKVIRSHLLAAYRSSVLHHDHTGQAILLNALLRSYVNANLYDQADKLVSKVQFPETRSNNQLARYLYYLGRIRAVQLDYSEAVKCLQEALRKAPHNGALGFRVIVQKLIVVVQLLTGDIPDREIFRQPKMTAALKPYLEITKTVRDGNLQEFSDVFSRNKEVFSQDRTMTLVTRLRQNVIKAGLRKLNTCYSRISISDLSERLNLDSVQDAEFVIAKAIRDGVIDATINHDESFMCSNETYDTYATIEPSNAFHNRISFCLNIHNEAVRAMRFPEAQDDFETAEARRERLKEEQELAHTLADEDAEDDDEGF